MNPLGFLVNILAGPIVNAVVDVVKDNNKTSVNKSKLEADVKKAVLASLTQVTHHQKDVIVAEINSQDKFVRRWRPAVAYSFGFVLLFYALFLPIAVDWFGVPTVRVGDLLLNWIYTLMGTMLGGYMGMRTVEKIARIMISK
jgi:hypothetical protein